MTSPAKIQALHDIRDQHAGRAGAIQCDRVRAALSQFGLTTFEAMRYLDVYDPPARVRDLRRAGASIDTHWQTITTEAGSPHRVGVYVLRPANVAPSAALEGGAYAE